MRWIRKSIVFWILIISFFQCSDSSYKNKDRIRIFYPIAEMETPVPLTNCDMIFRIEFLADTIINDKEFINNLDSIINSLSVANDTTDHINYRMKLVIRYSNQAEKVICLGDNAGIVCDGIRMQDDKEIFIILKKLFYEKPVYMNDPYDFPKIDYNKKW